MKKYQISIRKKAFKGIRKLDKKIGRLVDQQIDLLAENPRPEGCNKLVGLENVYRVRVGKIRIVYRIKDKEVLIVVLSVAHRKDIYKIVNR